MLEVLNFETFLFIVGWAGGQALILLWIFYMGPAVVREKIEDYWNWRARRELRGLQRMADGEQHCQFVSDWLKLFQGLRTKGELEEVEIDAKGLHGLRPAHHGQEKS